MKTIIAGSRTITDYSELLKVIKNSGWQDRITEVVSGGARGVDKMGEKWAKENKVSIKIFLANWDKYSKKAGYLRNIEMAKYADAVLILWDGSSRGAKHMIDTAFKHDLHYYWEIIK